MNAASPRPVDTDTSGPDSDTALDAAVSLTAPAASTTTPESAAPGSPTGTAAAGIPLWRQLVSVEERKEFLTINPLRSWWMARRVVSLRWTCWRGRLSNSRPLTRPYAKSVSRRSRGVQ